MPFDPLKLENQLCFPLYAAAKEVVRRYRPFLEPLGLTYTQYIAMMVMWEHEEITSGKMASCVCLSVDEATQLKALLEKVIL